MFVIMAFITLQQITYQQEQKLPLILGFPVLKVIFASRYDNPQTNFLLKENSPLRPLMIMTV
jgi:hypothetical protein